MLVELKVPAADKIRIKHELKSLCVPVELKSKEEPEVVSPPPIFSLYLAYI
jgi:hypothetical protein